MGGIQLVPAELGGIVTESAMYGIFFVLFCGAIYVLVNRQRVAYGTTRYNKIMLAASLILFCSITLVS